jgi:hypothetical protein
VEWGVLGDAGKIDGFACVFCLWGYEPRELMRFYCFKSVCFKRPSSFGRNLRAVYHHAQWLSDQRTTVAHPSRISTTAAASGLQDACGGLVAVVCRKGA